MEEFLRTIARKLWPDIDTLSGLEYSSALFNVIGFLYTAPLVLVGIGWLIYVSDPALIYSQWLPFAIILILLFVFERLQFYFFVEISPGIYSDWQASLSNVITWSAALIFGYSGLWLAVLHSTIFYARRWWKYPSVDRRWSTVRNFSLNLVEILASLVALTLYSRLAEKYYPGKVFPLPGLDLYSILPAIYATLVWWLLPVLIWLPLLMVFEHIRTKELPNQSHQANLKFWVSALGWPILVGPFAILAAGLYTQNGIGGYLFLVASFLLASGLANYLSRTVERSQQRSRELEMLEKLGRALLEAPPDASTLPVILQEQVSDMFPLSSIAIRIQDNPFLPAGTILNHTGQGALVPLDRLPVSAEAWDWLSSSTQTHCFLPGEQLPWTENPTTDAIAAVPILDTESSQPIGGILLSKSWQPETINSLIPAVQSLGAQIASALHRARVHTQTLEHQRVEQELALAWQIQESFLPDTLPQIAGWELSAVLEPARETSGDFYDLIPLRDNKLGILIADVADKGTGAALYMAVSRTLIRNYAAEFDTRSDRVLETVNHRLINDTRTDLFVSVFYGILDTAANTLTYCNAGHNPPYLVSSNAETQKLTRTGMALGAVEEADWEQITIQLEPGDLLVFYTDGVTDAENEQGNFFGETNLLEAILARHSSPAQEIQQSLMDKIHHFVGAAPRLDDITLVIVKRET